MISRLPESRLVSSPLERARETAEIAVGAGRPVDIDADLQEMDFGDWEGLSYDEVAARYPEAVTGWAEFRPDFGFPGGETLADFAHRIERVAGRLTEPETGTVVAFVHGGVVRALICHFLGLSLRDYLLFDVPTGGVAIMRLWGERGVLAGLGPVDTSWGAGSA